MKKIIKILLVFILVFCLASCNKTPKKVESFPEYVSKLESYKLTGKLYSMFPTGTKESLITVYYQKPNFYRVEIDNQTNGDKQIILKNNEGVFVLVPSVNKSFKLKSGWPINSSYPYLLESLSKDFVNDEDKVITKGDNETTIEMDVKMFENAQMTKQKVIFDNNKSTPKEVQIFDDKQNLVTRFVIVNFEEDPKFEIDMFNKSQTMTSYFETYSQIEYNRSTTYPTYYPNNTKLVDELKLTDDNLTKVIMTYSGEYNYTIVEQFIIPSELETTDYLDGDIYVIGDYVGIVNDNNITFVSLGIEYYIASNDVTTLEMFKMGNSLIVETSK
ncbi:MAG: outer membrane lipoprotein carrier protein LolA [Bacilli bacterium]|nr:outer membrane lipoprotein carrier protein LolA [Bacilli bacterium]